jgi:Beta-galactosidase
MRRLPNKRRRIMTLGVISLLLAAVIVGVGTRVLSSLQKPSVGTLSARATATATAQQYPNFKGIYQFGSNLAGLASNPYIAGAHLGYYWSQLEPQQGVYNWSAIDQQMAPWINYGKKVILRVSTSGWSRWAPPYSGNGTPQWVYNLGVRSVKENDGAIMPAYWNPIFLQNFADFVHAFAQRYDGNPHVAYIDIGLGVGGEAKVDSHNDNPNQLNLWKHIGYTNAHWWTAVQSIITAYTSSFTHTPLAVMPDKVFIESEPGYSEAMLLDYAVLHGLWLQDNALAADRQLPPQFLAVPHPEEQIASTSDTGDTLLEDIQKALDLGANYILVFNTDLKQLSYQATLKWATSKMAPVG